MICHSGEQFDAPATSQDIHCGVRWQQSPGRGSHVFAAEVSLMHIPLTPVQGAYRDNNGKPMVLDCVRKAEKLITGLNNME